ncbi:MAG: sulfotransferase [Caldilineaceae bacterium]|nr:sulfotransferase [Caldilineaceae bacterium]
MKPDFIVIGGQRCGTTALFTALRQHPEIFMPSRKEPRFFAFVDQPFLFVGPGAEHFRQGVVSDRADYQAMFATAAPLQRCGEASPVYLSAAQASASAVAMHQLAPDVRLIAILRQPAERTYSAYWHHRRLGIEPLADFRAALAAEDSRRDAGWLPGFDYRANSRYAANLRPYLSLFPRHQVCIVLYESWRQTPAAVLKQIVSFIGVSERELPKVESSINRATAPRNASLAHWLDRPHPLKQWGSRLLPKIWRDRIVGWVRRANVTNPPPLPCDLHAELTASFRDDILELQALLNWDLSHWLAAPTPKSRKIADRRQD